MKTKTKSLSVAHLSVKDNGFAIRTGNAKNSAFVWKEELDYQNNREQYLVEFFLALARKEVKLGRSCMTVLREGLEYAIWKAYENHSHLPHLYDWRLEKPVDGGNTPAGVIEQKLNEQKQAYVIEKVLPYFYKWEDKQKIETRLERRTKEYQTKFLIGVSPKSGQYMRPRVNIHQQVHHYLQTGEDTLAGEQMPMWAYCSDLFFGSRGNKKSDFCAMAFDPFLQEKVLRGEELNLGDSPSFKGKTPNQLVFQFYYTYRTALMTANNLVLEGWDVCLVETTASWKSVNCVL